MTFLGAPYPEGTMLTGNGAFDAQLPYRIRWNPISGSILMNLFVFLSGREFAKGEGARAAAESWS